MSKILEKKEEEFKELLENLDIENIEIDLSARQAQPLEEQIEVAKDFGKEAEAGQKQEIDVQTALIEGQEIANELGTALNLDQYMVQPITPLEFLLAGGGLESDEIE